MFRSQRRALHEKQWLKQLWLQAFHSWSDYTDEACGISLYQLDMELEDEHASHDTQGTSTNYRRSKIPGAGGSGGSKEQYRYHLVEYIYRKREAES